MSTQTYDRSTPVTIVDSLTTVTIGVQGGNRAVTRGNDGVLYAVFSAPSGSPNQIKCYKSIDHGETWASMSFPEVSGYDQFYPTVVVDSNNQLYVAWPGKDVNGTSKFNIKYCVWDGSSWGSVLSITSGNVYAQNNPSMDIDSSGNPHIVWMGMDSTDTSMYNIRYTKWNGTTFDTPTKVTSGNSYQQYYPQIKIDHNDIPHLVWYGADATENPVHNIRYTKWNGSDWDTVTKLTTGNTYYQSAPSIDIDSNNYPHVTWSGTDATDTNYSNIRYRAWDGSSWGTAYKVTSGNVYTLSYPSITVDKNDNIYITYSGKTPTYPEVTNIRGRRKISGSWGSLYNITTGNTYNQRYHSAVVNYKDFTQLMLIVGLRYGSSSFKVTFRGYWQETTTNAVTREVISYVDNCFSSVEASGGRVTDETVTSYVGPVLSEASSARTTKRTASSYAKSSNALIEVSKHLTVVIETFTQPIIAEAVTLSSERVVISFIKPIVSSVASKTSTIREVLSTVKRIESTVLTTGRATATIKSYFGAIKASAQSKRVCIKETETFVEPIISRISVTGKITASTVSQIKPIFSRVSTKRVAGVSITSKVKPITIHIQRVGVHPFSRVASSYTKKLSSGILITIPGIETKVSFIEGTGRILLETEGYFSSIKTSPPQITTTISQSIVNTTTTKGKALIKIS